MHFSYPVTSEMSWLNTKRPSASITIGISFKIAALTAVLNQDFILILKTISFCLKVKFTLTESKATLSLPRPGPIINECILSIHERISDSQSSESLKYFCNLKLSWFNNG